MDFPLFLYDRNGNLPTRTVGEEKGEGESSNSPYTTYTYQPDINRLQSVDIRSDGDRQPTTTYTYNGFSQRAVKKAGDRTTIYHYDINGQLIAETTPDGNLIKAYVWLNGQPLAMIDADGNVYYYHNDHLGTPQRMTGSKGKLVWNADYFPFGKVDVTMARVENNWRFMGQYFDAETDLHYNWHRYYDPDTGRYLTPDPIRLEGGINLFAYTSNNPINLIDPWGLATYIVNRELCGDKAKHSHNQVSHTYVVVTDDNGNVLHTYSWGNEYEGGGNPLFSNGKWVPDADEDVKAAEEALDRGWAIKIDDGDLDPFVQQAYALIEDGPEIIQHPWTLYYNCKFEARRLIRWAKEMRERYINDNNCIP